jgi:hypothetical protein
MCMQLLKKDVNILLQSRVKNMKENTPLLMSCTSVLIAPNMKLCLIMYTAHCKLYNLDKMKNTEKRQECTD